MNFLDFLGRFHLILLHFPIGLLGLAIVLEVLARWQNRPELRPASQLTLAWGAVAALVAAACGWLLAERGFYDPAVLFWHKWLGFGTVGLAAAAWWQRGTTAYFPLLLACGASLIFGGHHGGTLTHGRGFLTEPFETEAAAIATPLKAPKPETVVFKDIIQPIFQKKCVSCHNPTKAKGKLLLSSTEGIRAGGESGRPTLVAGRPDSSEIYRRASLPMADEKHMPPSGRVQLTPDELTLLRWWIAEGADFQRRFADMKPNAEVQAIFEKAKNALPANPVFSKKIKPADSKTLAELRSAGLSVLPLGAESPWLSASYAGQRDLTTEKIGLLKKISTQLVHLDLGNARLDAAGLKTVAGLPHLTRLNLAGTAVTDADLKQLDGLEFLETLNLTGTSVSDAGLDALFQMKNLRNLHVWKTRVTPAGIEKLRTQRADLQINTGTPLDTSGIAPQLRTPKIKYARTIFSDTVHVELDRPFSNIDLFYSLDEASPTTQSPRYDGKPFVFEKTTRLRTFAARQGWGNSPVAEMLFVKKRLSPKSVALAGPPAKQYPAKGGASLNDGLIAEDRSNDFYLGYQGEHLTATLDFGETVDFQRVSVHCFEDNNAWIFLPAGLKTWISDDGKRWQPFAEGRYEPPASMQAPPRAAVLSESGKSPARARYLKVRVESLLKNPKWHPSGGQPCWIFVDEILVE